MNPATGIRPATSDDLDLIMELEHAGFAAGRWSRQAWASEIVASDRQVLLAVEPAEAVGVITIRQGQPAELLRVAVAADRRRRGTGAALVRAAMATLEPGTEELWLEVAEDNPARNFYQQLGFVESGRRPRYYPGGVSAVIMRTAVPQVSAESTAGGSNG